MAGAGRVEDRESAVRICAAVVGAYAALIGLLVLVILAESRQVNVPLVVLCVLGLAVAAVTARVRRGWTLWLALAYSAFTLAADAPHQLPEIVHPTTATHTIGAAVLLAAGVVAVVVVIWAGLAVRREPAAGG
jgi:hypothetical protein